MEKLLRGNRTIRVRKGIKNMVNTEFYDANVKIRNFPRASDNILNALAGLRGVPKWELIREALIEYASNHVNELEKAGSEV